MVELRYAPSSRIFVDIFSRIYSVQKKLAFNSPNTRGWHEVTEVAYEPAIQQNGMGVNTMGAHLGGIQYGCYGAQVGGYAMPSYAMPGYMMAPQLQPVDEQVGYSSKF